MGASYALELFSRGMNFKAVQELTHSGTVGLLPPEPSLWDIFETVWLSGLSCPVCLMGTETTCWRGAAPSLSAHTHLRTGCGVHSHTVSCISPSALIRPPVLSTLSQKLMVSGNAARAPQKLLLSAVSESQCPSQCAFSRVGPEAELCLAQQLPGTRDEAD